MSRFVLETRPVNELNRANDALVRLVKRAIQITPIDFAVADGLRTLEEQKRYVATGARSRPRVATRTLEEQKRYVATGASQTLNSRHLTGHAVDLAAINGNKARWELDLLCKVAEAIRSAVIECEVPPRWGGHWDVLLTEEAARPRRTGAGLHSAPHFSRTKTIC